MSFNEKLGRLLRNCREDKKLSREKLAEICNISDRCISNIERGVSNPKFETVVKLFKALDIKFDVLNDLFEELELYVAV